ncbi:hypothetical protein NY588_12375 [Curtobacterium flaccumfaciens pv. beticola]|uniref:hypothetical protein n=1 Tax=Curtobacterium flaccumfaciens TaxID=2035 RepID=UPI00349F8D94|nr:hypothetical protein [Curtobacterium flaccumfaciens pv. basellae]
MIVRRVVDRNRVDRRPDRALDRELLLGYFSLLILALLVAAFWATVILSRSNALVATGVASAAVLLGLVGGRSRRRGARGVTMLVLLAGLIAFSALAGRGHSYQFAWLFPALTGLLLARPEWPWWRSDRGRSRGRGGPSRRKLLIPQGAARSAEQSVLSTERSTALTAPEPQSRHPKNRNGLVFGLLGAAAVFTILVFTWNQGVKAYDRSHVIRVDCLVTAAEPEIGGSTSGRGSGTLFDQITVDSPDCGPLTIRRGITGGNKQQIAERLGTQERWSFRVGAGSFELRSVLHLLGEPVVAQGFSEIREHE